MILKVNDHPVEVAVRSDEMLLPVLRRAGFTSVRETCGIGVCGACTVVVDGAAMSGCLLLARAVEGRSIETAEGLIADDPVVRAFDEHHAFQCGFCTPGMVLAAKTLLGENAHPSDAEIRTAMSGNLCRCGSYVKIVDAIRSVAT